MNFNKAGKILFLVLSILSFGLSFPPMLAVFKIPNPIYILIPIVCLSLIAFIFESYLYKLPLYFLSILLCTYASSWLTTKISFSTFMVREYHIVQKFFFLKEIDYTPMVSYLLFLMFLLLLVELQFVYKKVILVGFLCIGYLLLLSIFNDITVAMNIVLVALVTILLNVLIDYKRLSLQLLITITFILMVIGGITLFLPKDNLKSELLTATESYRHFIDKKGIYYFIANQGSEKYRKTGFSENDTHLGGSMTDDYTIQFKVKQDEPHYWKIDNKSVYTGQGWEKASKEAQNSSHFYNEITFSNGKADDSNLQEIELDLLYDEEYVPSTYGNITISGVGDNIVFKRNEHTGRVTMEGKENNKSIILQLYPLEYQADDLKKTSAKIDSPDIDYLQLPQNFPKIIKDLAIKLTKGKTNDYEKVKAIETYLKTSRELRYSKEDTSYPEENEDYVADFLFTSHVGYCDNFSTAMAVMLRTIDIPTRWVKGFSPGGISSMENGQINYVIKNSNAHSWVEVYFRDYGWIPFEPTPSFSYPQNEKTYVPTEAENTLNQTQVGNTSIEQENSSLTSSTTDAKDDEELLFEDRGERKKLRNNVSILLVLFIVCLLILVGKYWLLWWTLGILNTSLFSFAKTYPYLLRKAEKWLPRGQEQDLMSYAKYFEKKYPQFQPHFSKLTKIYEEIIYGDRTSFSDKDKKIVKRLVILLHKK